MSEERIYEEVRKEREYQTGRWGTEADDKLNNPTDWMSYIAHYSGRWMKGGFRPYPTETLQQFRVSMIKVAALAVAAAAWADRVLDKKIVRDDVLEAE